MVNKCNYLIGAPGTVAKAVLRVVPLVMKTVRAEMRACPACRAASLSVPQFRTLNFIDKNTGASLSDVAEHIGVTLPAMSRLVDGLVERKLLTRTGHAGDRRKLVLRLTCKGMTLLQAAHKSTEASIASRLAALNGEELAEVASVMVMLRPLFSGTAKIGDDKNL